MVPILSYPAPCLILAAVASKQASSQRICQNCLASTSEDSPERRKGGCLPTERAATSGRKPRVFAGLCESLAVSGRLWLSLVVFGWTFVSCANPVLL